MCFQQIHQSTFGQVIPYTVQQNPPVEMAVADRNFYEILRPFGRASSFIDMYIWRGFGDKILVERLY